MVSNWRPHNWHLLLTGHCAILVMKLENRVDKLRSICTCLVRVIESSWRSGLSRDQVVISRASHDTIVLMLEVRVAKVVSDDLRRFAVS